MVCANALLRGAARSESGNWRKQKIATPAGQPPSGEPEVEIEFPFGTKEKACDGDKYVVPTRRARLADACEVVDETAPDLVLLGLVAPISLPGGVLALHPAVRLEVGTGHVHTYLASRKRYSAVDGTIDQRRTQMGCANFVVFNHKYIGSKKDRAAHPSFFRMGSSLRASLPSRSLMLTRERAICARRLPCPRQQIANISNGFEHDSSRRTSAPIPASYKT